MVSSGLERAAFGHHFVTGSSQSLTPLEKALQKTRGIGTYECADFRHKIFARNQAFAYELASNYVYIANNHGYVQANVNLSELDKRFQYADFKVACSAEQLKRFAQLKAEQCQRIANDPSLTDNLKLDHCIQIASDYGIKFERQECDNEIEADLVEQGHLKRFSHSKWWKYKLTKVQKRVIESVARDIGTVHKFRTAYASQFAQSRHAFQKQQTLQYLKTTFLENDEGQSYCLKDLHDKSVSNPDIRRAELMTRINGFELVADQLGHEGLFLTITTPSRFHARLGKSGKANSKYDGSNPLDAQDYLQKQWQRIRSKLKRDGINIYGFRVAEPHHDGTPHWHLLFFVPPGQKTKTVSIFRHYCLNHSEKEKGASKHRCKVVYIDKSKGSAAGYIAKYISKNIDGYKLDKDLEGQDAKSSANAISAWASTWGIRQFQQIGGASVTVWRELRRISQQEDNYENPQLTEAMSFASAADWAAYTLLMGGPTKPRKQQLIQPLYHDQEFFDEDTGELFVEALTAYGDPAHAALKGLIVDGEEIITKTTKWRIVKATTH